MTLGTEWLIDASGCSPEALANLDRLRAVFDRIIRDLDLKRPIYRKTAAYGHFGRTEKTFTWERPDRADEMADALLPPKLRAERRKAAEATQAATKGNGTARKTNGDASASEGRKSQRAPKGTGRHANAAE